MERKRDDMTNKNGLINVRADDLRALLFWASVGVHLSKGGHRQEEIPDILECYASQLRFELPHPAKFAKEPTK